MDQLSLPRRVRHITSVRICNITPFPVRDAATSALSRPAEQPQFAAHGHLSDDTDVALARKRARRISSTSISTLKSLRDVEEREGEDGTGSPTSSKHDHETRLSVDVTRALSDSSKIGGSSSRKGTTRRKRADSTASRRAGTSLSGISWIPSTARTTSTFANTLPDHSQGTLDKILRSRLTETFLAISVPIVQDDDHDGSQPTLTPTTMSPLSPRFPPLSPVTSRFVKQHRPTMSTPVATTSTPPHSPLVPPSSAKNAHAKAGSVSSASSRSRVSSTPQFVLAYLSPIHRPSTNPQFDISTEDIIASANNAATIIKVEVYGKHDSTQGWSDNRKGKQKADDEIPDNSWHVLDSWMFDLGSLVPLSEDLAIHPTSLPSNSLIITLEPFGTAFYLPPSPPSRDASRPPSPSGYNSDPESTAETVRRARASSNSSNTTELFLPPASPLASANSTMSTFSEAGVSRMRNRLAKTVGFPDLVKLVTLQTVVTDTQHSLDEVMNSIERNILSDGVVSATRALGEHEAVVNGLRHDIASVEKESEDLRQHIVRRRAELEQRREALNLARGIDLEDTATQLEEQHTLSDSRDALTALRQRTAPVRTDLLTTLATLFPIELVAPEDLLFAIVDVPLPIPVAPSDPAPPLTLAAHKELNEETVASALGFAAQVVVLLAAYMGHRLVYPITCIGSRSLVKDEISAMVGPRMFPLYSKGVDTYRFEYGVFLLNKNIEMLMAERNLRALDIRHTLPNLKNLLLTLTDGGSVRSGPPIRNFSILSTDSLATTASTGVDSVQVEAQIETTTSGNTTPTNGDATPKKAKSYFGLSGFLRSRYPSVKPSVKPVAETAEESVTQQASPQSPEANNTGTDDNADDDDADRRTIRGHSVEESSSTTAAESEAEEEGKREMNGHTNLVLVADRSKEHKLVVTVSPSSPAPPVVS